MGRRGPWTGYLVYRGVKRDEVVGVLRRVVGHLGFVEFGELDVEDFGVSEPDRVVRELRLEGFRVRYDGEVDLYRVED